MLSCIPYEGLIGGIVDAPNACATLTIPLAISTIYIYPLESLDKLEGLAQNTRITEENVALPSVGRAVPHDPHTPST